MKTLDSDLIIVGAGILGLSAAIQAAEQGLKVQLFEKDAEPVGATRRNFGMIGTSTLTHPESEWHKHALSTRDFYQRIQAQTDISFQQRNGLYLANTELEWQVLNEFAVSAPDYDIPVQLLSREQTLQQFGWINPQVEIRGGMIFHEDYSVEPQLIGKRLLQYAQQLGVEIHCNACVVKTSAGCEPGIKEVHLASGETYRTEKVLICHGELTQLLYPELLQNMGLLRCSLQMALTQPFKQHLNASVYSGLSISRYPAFEICSSHAELTYESRQGLVKDYGIHILLKQNMNGQIILGDSHEYYPVEEMPQFYQREEINHFIQDYCQTKIGLTLPQIEFRWNGYYLTHPEQPACVTEAEPGIFLISAVAGKGMTTGAGFMKEILEKHIF